MPEKNRSGTPDSPTQTSEQARSAPQTRHPDDELTTRATALEPSSQTAELTRRELLGAASGMVGAAACAAPPDELGSASQAATTTPGATAAASQPIYRIHPALGFARLGNADPSTYFIGPEAPGYGPLGEAPGTTAPPYKVDGKVKPQAVRFRLYEYGYVDNRLVPLREVTLDTPGVVDIRWSVHLANKKASFNKFGGPPGESTPPLSLRNASVTNRRSLEIDFGARSTGGRSAAPVEFRPGGSDNPANEACPLDFAGQPVIDYLGQLRTDAQGRLIALGGKGKAAFQTAAAPPLPHYANNDGWFDDASDGPVTATVTITDASGTRQVPVDARGAAWLFCGPPDFAPRIRATVTGYDLLFDLAVRAIAIPPENGLYDNGGPLEKLRRMKNDFRPGIDPELSTYVPSFDEDIQPLLLTGYNFWFVDGLVTAKHNHLIEPELADPGPAGQRHREMFLAYMRPPLGLPATGKGTMPKLLGDDPYVGVNPDGLKKLTLTHVQWALAKRYAAGAFTPPTGASPPPPTISPAGLDRAALENTVGGAFFPGIEFGWQLRNPALFIEPFRLNPTATSGYYGETGQPIGPGHFTRQMAVPWHADFNDCRNEGSFGWWPSQRPTDVLPSLSETMRADWARPTRAFSGGNRESTHEDMVQHWYQFGFVVEEGGVFYESERAPQIP